MKFVIYNSCLRVAYTIKSKQIKHDRALWPWPHCFGGSRTLDKKLWLISPLIYEFLLHFTYVKSIKGNNSHMESLDTFVSFDKIIRKILMINGANWWSYFVVIHYGCNGLENKRQIVFGDITLTKRCVPWAKSI